MDYAGVADLVVATAILDGGREAGRAAVVEALVGRLAEAGHVPAAAVNDIRDAVLRREALGSTGIGRGVAAPHARSPAVPRPLGVLAACREPVDFDALDGEPVDLVVLLLAPPDRGGRGPGRPAGGLFRLLVDDGFCGRARRAAAADDLAALVRGAAAAGLRPW